MKKITLFILCLSILVLGVLSCSVEAIDRVNTPEEPENPVDPENPTVARVTATTIASLAETSAVAAAGVTSNGGSTVTARGFCWGTTQNPTISGTKSTETGDTGAFTSTLQGLTANTLYYIRAYATNAEGTAYGAQNSFTTGTTAAVLPVVTTAAITAITETGASGGGNVAQDGGSPILARGICWATTQEPVITGSTATATGTTGAFTAVLTGLTASTTYYVRAYATNAAGTGYGTQVSFTTAAPPANNGPQGGTAVCNGSQPTAVVTITSSTGKIWMDRNLGASRAATTSKDYEAYGCLYQWGRGNDGHASINWARGEADDWGNQAGAAVNGSTYTLSTSDTPPDALFIKDETSRPYDWRSPKNDNLWQGANGINNPCPAGFRVPTRVEFKAEITAYSITGATSAFNSIHKFPMAGDRAFDSGSVRGQGEDIFYWTSTTDSGDAYNVLIQSGGVYTNTSNGRAGGYSVRCIKD